MGLSAAAKIDGFYEFAKGHVAMADAAVERARKYVQDAEASGEADTAEGETTISDFVEMLEAKPKAAVASRAQLKQAENELAHAHRQQHAVQTGVVSRLEPLGDNQKAASDTGQTATYT